jgi:hypothetical protein
MQGQQPQPRRIELLVSVTSFEAKVVSELLAFQVECMEDAKDEHIGDSVALDTVDKLLELMADIDFDIQQVRSTRDKFVAAAKVGQ